MENPSFGVEGYRYFFSVHAESLGRCFETRVRFSTGHETVVDEPEEFGGCNAGPNPIELLLASLASCFVISLLIHAKRLSISIDRVEVHAEGWFDIRGFLALEGFEPGMEKIVLRAKVLSRESCEKLKQVIDRVLRGWVVGSILMKSGVLKVSIDIPSCRT